MRDIDSHFPANKNVSLEVMAAGSQRKTWLMNNHVFFFVYSDARSDTHRQANKVY